jgi:GTPase SAR1 family protein
MTTVTLSLISHTNVGKTSLARTLLRREIGEVRDQPHVTTVAEAHVLIETAEARLLLWDTPGFGDTVRLMTRLRRERDPIGWLLHQVWDRLVDRPLWCSQEAVRNVREEADVVLYLVNATEDPETAGYMKHELASLS